MEQNGNNSDKGIKEGKNNIGNILVGDKKENEMKGKDDSDDSISSSSSSTDNTQLLSDESDDEDDDGDIFDFGYDGLNKEQKERLHILVN